MKGMRNREHKNATDPVAEISNNNTVENFLNISGSLNTKPKSPVNTRMI